MEEYSNEYKWHVFKFNVYDSEFYFVLASDLPRLTGFASLYAIREEDKAVIEAKGSYAGWRGVVWSPTLALDFDTEESGLEAWQRVKQLRLNAHLYKSGGKGYHIEISRPHGPSEQLPQIDKEWVLGEFSLADKTIYTPLHLFRLAGTKHEKTGEYKKWHVFTEGVGLYLVDKLQIYHKIEKCANNVTVTESLFTNESIMSLTVPHENGQRHANLLKLAVSLRHAGEGTPFIARWLHHTNLLFEDPTPQEEIDKILDFVGAI